MQGRGRKAVVKTDKAAEQLSLNPRSFKADDEGRVELGGVALQSRIECLGQTASVFDVAADDDVCHAQDYASNYCVYDCDRH